MNYKKWAVLSALIITLMCVSVSAQTRTVYNSIPNPLPANVASEGPEAYAFAELGDGLGLAGTGGTLNKVSVVLSSWACQNGNWNSGSCVTKNNAKFQQPITINIYGVLSGNVTGPLLGSATRTFDIPYRPSSTPALCGGDNQVWYNSKDNSCYHGIATQVEMNLADLHIAIPANNQVIVTVAYNTSHYGPAPIGQSTSCYGTSAGCPYDSLNIATDTTDGTFNFIGAPIDPNGIFVNYSYFPQPGNSCSGAQPMGVLADDTPCWAGFQPEIQVVANTNPNPTRKGNAP
jgi:hypothetical protein